MLLDLKVAVLLVCSRARSSQDRFVVKVEL
jgi:hypothetical protein